MPFIEAFRQFNFRVKRENFCNIHVSLVPQPKTTGEFKTKPTQNSLHTLRGQGLIADMVCTRTTLYNMYVFICSFNKPSLTLVSLSSLDSGPVFHTLTPFQSQISLLPVQFLPSQVSKSSFLLSSYHPTNLTLQSLNLEVLRAVEVASTLLKTIV